MHERGPNLKMQNCGRASNHDVPSLQPSHFIIALVCVILSLLIAFVLLKTKLETMESKRLSPNDPSTYSRPEQVKATNIHLRLQADFERKIFHGYVDITAEKQSHSENTLILDVKNLDIKAVVDQGTNNPLQYDVGQANGEFGSKMTVTLPTACARCIVTIAYETSPFASGLQWLEPQQTAGKRQPYVFSQFQAIHARSFLPCQDTPSVKTPYTAEITVPKELTAVMSAIRKDRVETDVNVTYKFEQKVPIQSYLIAIAIGKLESREIGPRSTVWAEQEVIEEAAYEFAETEKQLLTAEEICGPYVWGIYDLLVLPPSFPFGGMENPCLTFVTPTLLAGDRSLANVVAHEIAHSWSGNLVTNSNFEHFWLNEGFTVFIERKILGRLQGRQLQDFSAYGATAELQETVNRLGVSNPLTCLVIDLTGVHPDDAFSLVPYEKGQTFLRYLEHVVGGPVVFEPFLRKYFDTFKYKSITTDDFQKFFEQEFPKASGMISWSKWLHKAGMPPTIPDYDMTIYHKIEALRDRWMAWDVTSDCPFTDADFDTQLHIQFLQKLLEEEPQPIAKLDKFDQVFHFTKAKNCEIKFRWLRVGIRAHWEKIIPPTIGWVNEVGRMKYTRPLYRDLYNWEFSRDFAIKNFEAHRVYMMYVAAYTISQDLNLS